MSKQDMPKMLGALVPESVYWKFKAVAAERKETVQEAIMHAAMLYIDAVDKNKEQAQEGTNGNAN